MPLNTQQMPLNVLLNMISKITKLLQKKKALIKICLLQAFKDLFAVLLVFSLLYENM